MRLPAPTLCLTSMRSGASASAETSTARSIAIKSAALPLSQTFMADCLTATEYEFSAAVQRWTYLLYAYCWSTYLQVIGGSAIISNHLHSHSALLGALVYSRAQSCCPLRRHEVMQFKTSEPYLHILYQMHVHRVYKGLERLKTLVKQKAILLDLPQTNGKAMIEIITASTPSSSGGGLRIAFWKTAVVKLVRSPFFRLDGQYAARQPGRRVDWIDAAHEPLHVFRIRIVVDRRGAVFDALSDGWLSFGQLVNVPNRRKEDHVAFGPVGGRCAEAENRAAALWTAVLRLLSFRARVTQGPLKVACTFHA